MSTSLEKGFHVERHSHESTSAADSGEIASLFGRSAQGTVRTDRIVLAQLEKVRLLADSQLIADLARRNAPGPLLDSTMVLYGSNMGDTSVHDNQSLSILLAGGGFQHGQHFALGCDKNTPLRDLYVSMIWQSGVQVDVFRSSTGTSAGSETRA